VTQALTRKLRHKHKLPEYLHSLLPSKTDWITKELARGGLWAIFESLETVERESPLIEPPITVSSSHTKHALEDLHPNICVFRHPDHLPDRQNITSDFVSSFQNMKLTAANAAKLPVTALSALYGTTEDAVLYWAHHEKLCLIDGRTAFMGGLDLCYGRWDTNQHSIADAHPGDLNKIVFVGQDYNNSRIMDFQDVVHWQNNKLDRTQNSRMGWTDVSICISGPVVRDLQAHFVQRWNFIYNEKYDVRKDVRYSRLEPIPIDSGGHSFHRPHGSRGIEGEEEERGFGDGESADRGLSGGREGGFRDKILKKVEPLAQQVESKYGAQLGNFYHGHHQRDNAPETGTSVQLNRSCAKWSNGGPIEHSIANAYIETIRNSQHFVYIENQFFITASVDQQKPVKNRIGAAIVERIIRAARNGEKYHMIVLMPAVPAFAGDLRSDDALATRAIMEFQYNSINRGGHSIYETIARAGYNPMNYIRFYNLRNYDRINASGAMASVENASGVSYEDARKQYDEQHGGGFSGNGSSQSREPPPGGYQAYQPGPYELPDPNAAQTQTYPPPPPSQQTYPPPPPLQQNNPSDPLLQQGSSQQNYPPTPPLQQNYPPPPPLQQQPSTSSGYGDHPQYAGTNPYGQYQEAAQKIGGPLSTGRWDSVAECYMLNGEDIRNVPWEGGNVSEIDAFVTEELYIHSKVSHFTLLFDHCAEVTMRLL
jgi:phospholipase D1/2